MWKFTTVTPVELDGVGDAAQLRLADDVLAEVARRLAREDRVRLAGERRAEQAVVELGERPRADAAAAGAARPR